MTIASERADAFRKYASTVIEQEPGPVALEQISQAHIADLDGMQAQLNGYEGEVEHAIINTRMRSDMLFHLHKAISDEVLKSSRLYAHMHLAQHIVEQVRGLAANAEDGTVSVAEITHIMGEPLPAIDVTPVIVAYHPDLRYSYGQFVSADGAILRAFPFTGWSLLSGVPTIERGIEPTFLVETELVPKSTVEARYGLLLQRLAR